MLTVSRPLNPECDHQQGDMRVVRLGRTFSAVTEHTTENRTPRELFVGRRPCV